MATKAAAGAGRRSPAAGIKLAPEVLVKLLHRRKQYEDELATMGRDLKIVREVTRPSASYRGGSWKQHVLNSVGAIQQIDRMLILDRIVLPKPDDWWTPPGAAEN